VEVGYLFLGSLECTFSKQVVGDLKFESGEVKSESENSGIENAFALYGSYGSLFYKDGLPGG
jgi:hypothetical protein